MSQHEILRNAQRAYLAKQAAIRRIVKLLEGMTPRDVQAIALTMSKRHG